MARLIHWSLENRALVLFLSLLWLLVGLRSLQQLPIDAVPDVTNVQVTVNTEAPGLSPPEVESLVTVAVEGGLLGLPAVEEVRSLSKYGLSQVTVVFRERTDLYFARQVVGERLNGLGEELPEQVSAPTMGPIATGLSEIYQYELIGDERWDPISLRTLQDWFVKRQLLAVDGVTEVNSFGGLEKEYQVVLNPQALQSYGLSYSVLFQAAGARSGYLPQQERTRTDRRLRARRVPPPGLRCGQRRGWRRPQARGRHPGRAGGSGHRHRDDASRRKQSSGGPQGA